MAQAQWVGAHCETVFRAEVLQAREKAASARCADVCAGGGGLDGVRT